ncbi:MobF family relaxase [Stenotrophomonas maltophilia]|nr:MobF family relaxase [Stenotrophomonas maltophilia]MCD5965513.1 relaxase domain-containing protein [Stenotrophomonas maltophilia]
MIGIKLLKANAKSAKGDDVVEYLLASTSIELTMDDATKSQVQDSSNPATDYYAKGTKRTIETSYWAGKLAAKLGLIGQTVEKSDMMALFDGFSPSGKPLCQNAGAKPTLSPKINRRTGKPRLNEDGSVMMVETGGRRGGYDLTFSPPKSVSLLYALGDDKMKSIVIEAQRKAVEAAMTKIFEEYTQCRRGKGGKDVIDVKSLIYSHHLQFGNRNLEPHIHTHTLLYNVCEGEDKQYSTFDASEIFRFRYAGDMTYQNVVATELRKAGLSIVQSEEINAHGEKTGQRFWEVAGLHDRDLIDEFSTRHLEIMHERSNGTSDAEAWRKTRKNKDEPSYEELMDHFDKLVADVRKHRSIPTVDELMKEQGTRAQPRTREELLEYLHQNDSAFSYPTLLKQLGMENIGYVSADELFNMCNKFTEDESDLLCIKALKLHVDDMGETLARRHTEARYAAKWMADFEVQLVQLAKSREKETWWKMDRKEAEASIAKLEKIKGFTVTDEQRRALEHITMNTGGVCIAAGLAGTGKTTVSDFYSQVYRDKGYRMLGCAVSNEAAMKLEFESKMECRSVSKILSDLKKKQLTLTDKDVVVLDEAGMIDVPQIRALSAWCNKAGAKLILQGDEEQLKPVGAGQGMSILSDVLGESNLLEIRRQKDEEMRRIVNMFYDYDKDGLLIKSRAPKSRDDVLDKSARLWEALEDAGCIDEYNTRDQAMKVLVEDYFSSQAPVEERLVLAHTNADLKALNAAIRKGFQDNGIVKSEQFHIQAIGKNYFEGMDIAVGDRIRFTASDSVMGVINGTTAEITAIKPNHKRGGYDVAVEIPELGGKWRKLTFNTEEWNAIRHNYATTIHGAQGQGKTDIFHLGNPGMTDNSSMMVALSRLTKGRYCMYVSSDDAETIRDRMGLDRNKENLLHAGIEGDWGDQVQEMFDKMVKEAPKPQVSSRKPPNPDVANKRKIKQSSEMEEWVNNHIAKIFDANKEQSLCGQKRRASLPGRSI